MAVAVQSVTTTSFTSLSSTDSLTITKPSGLAVGDLMLAHMCRLAAGGAIGAWDTPSGWTNLAAIDTTATSDANSKVGITVFHKVADSGDVAASTFSFNSNTAANLAGGALYRISGATTINALADSDTGTTTPTFTNSITPGAANSLLLFLFNAADASDTTGSASGYAIVTDNPTWTEQYDFTGNAGVGQPRGMMSGATASRTAVTATGNSSLTTVNYSQNLLGAMVVITPSVDVTVSPAVLSVVASVQAPSINGSANVSTAVITTTASVQAPTVSTPADTWIDQNKNSSSWVNTNKS